MLTNACIDALDPQGAEFALACPTVTISILQGLFDLLDCDTVICAGAAAKAFAELTISL